MNTKTITLGVLICMSGAALTYVIRNFGEKPSPSVVEHCSHPGHTHNEDHHHHHSAEPPPHATSAEVERERANALLRRKELEDRVNAVTAKAAAMHDPEDDRKMVDFIMREREPRYQALFNHWKLGADSRQAVIQSIRERELRRKEWQYQRRKAGVEGLGWTFSDPQSEKALGNTLDEVQNRQLTALDNLIVQEGIARSKMTLRTE